MLLQLYVKNFIIIDELQIRLHQGMHAFTGETGAGKSLLIDAISILKGEKLSLNFIKQGCDEVIVEGTFVIQCNSVISKLKEKGYDLTENKLVIRRTLNVQGKHTLKINNKHATVTFLKIIMNDLIDIHSQNDQQYLLQSKYHIELYDRFICVDQLRAKITEAYRLYKHEKEVLKDLQNYKYKKEDLDFLTYQFNEINDLNLQENELEEIERKITNFKQYKSLYETNCNVKELLQGETGILNKLYECNYHLQRLTNIEEMTPIREQFLNIHANLEELAISVMNKLNLYEYDEATLLQLQSRYDNIKNILKKYGGSVLSLFEKKRELEEAIDTIIYMEDRLKKQTIKIEKTYADYQLLAQKLHDIRVNKKSEVESLIQAHLKDLYLEHANFKIQIETFEGNHLGIDKLQFVVSLNPSQPLQSLSKSASGGELSRVMLALRTVFASYHAIPTVIFDEIDVGVSGRVAMAIGQKMKQLSLVSQVLCVTHLAQVAACANNQHLIKKDQQENSTHVSIHSLTKQERIQQLAAIATGNISKLSLLAAEELLEQAQSGKI